MNEANFYFDKLEHLLVHESEGGHQGHAINKIIEQFGDILEFNYIKITDNFDNYNGIIQVFFNTKEMTVDNWIDEKKFQNFIEPLYGDEVSDIPVVIVNFTSLIIIITYQC